LTACFITAATSERASRTGNSIFCERRQGGLKALFFFVFVTEDYYPARYETKQALRMIDTALGQIAKNANTIELAHNAEEIEAIRKRGKMPPRGYSKERIRKFPGGNLLRVFQQSRISAKGRSPRRCSFREP
jgi:microsomal dipeptidase-like Zn-dependent dipeptidase